MSPHVIPDLEGLFWSDKLVDKQKIKDGTKMKFSGTDAYVATDDLKIAVNASITLERPLLVKGEPGTGKTELAKQIAQSLNLNIIEWNIKSTTKAQQGLYEYLSLIHI